MSGKNEPPTLNMSAIPVAGVGGLGLLGIVAIMAFAFSPARWLLFSGIVGGCLVALALVVARRYRRIGTPRSDRPISLFPTGSEIDDSAPGAEREGKPTTRQEHRLAVS